jgi:hypothetical protein
VTRGARLCAWAVTSPARGQFPTSDFDAVFNSGFVSSSSTQWYGQNTIWTTFILSKIKHPFKPCALIPIVGEFRHPHARTGGVLIVAHRRVKHTDTIFYVVRQNRLHPRERFILLDIEIHGRRLHLLPLQQGCCHCSSLFSLYSHVLSLNLLFTLTLLSNNCLFYRHFMVNIGGANSLKAWHELWHNSCFHLLSGGVLPQMAIS